MDSNQNEDVRIKKPTTFSEQVEILMARGLTIEDRATAEDILSKISYYRLSAYTLHCKQSNKFKDGVSIENIYALYEFDKKFRNLVAGTLESIEIAFRTQIAYTLAHEYEATGYLNSDNFLDESVHKDTVDKLLNEIDRSDEIFVKHHKDKYEGVFPIWVAIEVASFGLVSRIYSNLKNEDKSTISKTYYNLPHRYVKSWLYALSTFRSKCAHHGRIYNKKLTIKPILHKKDLQKGIRNDQVFSVLYIIKKLIRDSSEWNGFVTNLEALIESYDMVDTNLMGFPEKWIEILRTS
ncbi:Abi family protein [Tindallia californiensis]|uniref:Abortive infection bacteriophage resistance protein n=1 Tax=Tindallia californiensis TaxID=159292 RepID=A0A1H3R713_9FIRM|nr:Abi family protein [Tindallia californiensis]SDZ21028.1 Abortive infection bacteriophage resistance protein [Tindallia californiensis]